MKRKILRKTRIVTILSALVVFLTVYSLVLPAITLTDDAATEDPGINTSETTNVAEVEKLSLNEETSGDVEIETTEQAEEDVQKEEVKEEKTVIENVNYPAVSFSDSLGDMIVYVEAPEGAFPENTQMKLKEVEDEAALVDSINSNLENKEVKAIKAVDITFIYNNEELEPLKPIKVSMTSSFIETNKEDEQLLVHVDNDNNTNIVETTEVKEKDAEAINNVEEVQTLVENTDEINEITTDNTVAFESDAFSVYAVVYTVDFEYGDYDFSLNGGASITLSDLLVKLGIKNRKNVEDFVFNEVTDVMFSDPDLISVYKVTDSILLSEIENAVFDLGSDALENDQMVKSGDWVLTSISPFESEEVLSIKTNDGSVISINVTDAQYDNLANFVNDATLEIDGKTYGAGSTWKVRPDVDYKLTLSFAEKGPRQLPKGGDEVIMDVPAGIELQPGASGTFDIPAGLAGTIKDNRWFISNDGKLHIVFGEDPNDILTRSSNVHFDLAINAKFDGTHTHFDFNDRVSRDAEYNNESDVSVNKTGSYNSSTGKMEYTITVKSTGKSEDVKVTDLISGDMLTLDSDSIQITPSDKAVSSENIRNNGFDITFGEMAHDEVVTIRYTASVDESKLGKNGAVIGDNGKNSVEVENKDKKKDTSENIVNTIKFSDLSKSSVSSTDKGETVELEWKIDANTGLRASIAGSKITDTIDHNSKDVMKYAVGEDGKLELTVKKTDSSGNSTTSTVKVDVSKTYDGGPETWTYVVPETDGVFSYEITYKTIATKQSNDITVKNNGTNESGGSSSGSGIVPGIGGGGDEPGTIVAGKTAKSVNEEYVEWDIVVNVPTEGFDELVVLDKLPYLSGDKHPRGDFADTFESISITGLDENEDYDYTVSKVNAAWGNDPDNSWIRRDGEPLGHEIVTITFYKDKAKTQNGLNEAESPRTLTITIKSKNDPLWMQWASGEGGNYFNTHINNGKVNTKDITAKATPVLSKLKKAMKEKRNSLDGVGNGLFYYYDIALSNVTEDPFVIEDHFDTELLEFVNINDYPGAYKPAYYIGAGVNDYDNITSDNNTPIYEITSSGLRITANNLLKQQDGSFYPYYHIRYYLRVKDGMEDVIKQQALANGGTYLIGNDAYWGELTDHVDVEYEVSVLNKEGKFNSDNERLYTFRIDVNPHKFQMNGNEMMEMYDSHTSNISVDYISIKAYEISDENIQTDPFNYNLNNYQICSDVTWNFDGNEGVFNIPDNKHIVIEYNCLIVGSGTQNFRNDAEMKGFIDGKQDSKDYGSEEHGGADVFQIKLLKYKDGLTSNGLEGAKFQLFKGTGEYVYDSNGNIVDEIKEEMKWGVGTETAGKVGENITFTTGSEGWVTIALDQTRHGNELEENVHYYLKEIDSPPGYQIDSSTEYWSFTLTQDPDEVNYGDPDRRDPVTGWRQWIYFYYDDVLKMANTETDKPLKVKVDKSWFDENQELIPEDRLDNTFVASIQLMQKKDDEPYKKVRVDSDGSIHELNDSDELGVVQLNSENSWSYEWTNLPRSEKDASGKTIHRYAYKVEEVLVDGYIVSVDETEDETTKTYALKNYKIPENSDTELSVKKQWVNYDNTVLDGSSENFPSEITFTLYQVSSKTPFTRVPTSGGNKYVIAGNDHLVKPSATDSDDLYAVYKMDRSEYDSGILFTNLPEVVNSEDGTMYYAYYVKENPIDGYSTSYLSENTSRTIINKLPLPEGKYIDIGLEKKWTDGTSTTPPSGAQAVFTVRQQKSTKIGGSAGDYAVQLLGSDKTTVLSTRKANVGDSLIFSGEAPAYSNSNVLIYRHHDYGYGWDYLGGVQANSNGDFSFSYNLTENDVKELDQVQIAIDSTSFIDGCTLGPKWDEGEPTWSNYENTDWTREITLPVGSNWSTMIKDLIQEDAEGNKYRYYITEDSCYPTPVSTVYKDDLGNGPQNAIDTDGKKVEVTNTFKDEKGSLSLTKLVKYKDNEPSSEQQYEYVDGSYRFKIVSGEGITPSVTKYVEIKVEDGQAKSYRIGDSEDALSDFVLGQKALISDLSPGNYIIEEVHKNGLMLTGLARGDNDKSAIDEEKGTLTVHVTGGDKQALEPSSSATFTNTYYEYDGPDKITLDVVKEFVGISSLNDVPDGADGFEVVLGYTDGGSEKTITLEKESDETNDDGIKIKASSDGLSISWHITNIPGEAKNFKIKEVRYDGIPGYRFVSASLDVNDITENAGEWHYMNVVAPEADLDKVTNERHTPDSEFNLRYELQDSDILLSKLTSNLGTLVISKKSLNSIERDAVVKGWPQQGGFKTPGIYFSIEEHPEGFSYGNKSIVFEEVDGKTYVKFTSNAAAQEDVFVVTYDSHSELNNASLKNTYSSQTVSLDIVKVEKNNVNTKLPAAEFTIQQIKDTLGASGIEYIGDPKTSDPTDASGKTIFEDISNGYYEIKETKLPRGYVITGDDSFYIKVDRGIIYLLEKDLSKNKLADWDSTKTKVGNVTFTAATETSAAIAQVENEPGTELPHTGGSGTALIKLIGIAVMLGAAAKVIEKRKQKNRRPEL